MNRIHLVVTVLTLAGLAACGEQPQTANISAKKSDSRVFENSQGTAHVVSGWKAGDSADWEEQMRRRVQNQNEYVRVK